MPFWSANSLRALRCFGTETFSCSENVILFVVSYWFSSLSAGQIFSAFVVPNCTPCSYQLPTKVTGLPKLFLVLVVR